mgnify:FL=1
MRRRCQQRTVFVYFILMTEHTYSISGKHLEMLIKYLDQSSYYCKNATYPNWDDPNADPKMSFAGAAGLALATTQYVSQNLQELMTK